MQGHGESLKTRRKWKHTTPKHRTLHVDWLINYRSGKTTLQPPWDEDNGSTIICVRALKFERYGLLKADTDTIFTDDCSAFWSTILFLAGWIKHLRQHIWILKPIKITVEPNIDLFQPMGQNEDR